MTHYIITNRAILLDETGKEYVRPDGGEAAGENLRFGSFDSNNYLATGDSKSSINLYADASSIPRVFITQTQPASPYTKADITTPELQLSGSARLFTDLYKVMSGNNGGDLLFFIHGFHQR